VTGGRSRIRLVAVVAALTALAASIVASSVSASRSAGDNGLMDPSTLVVGMDLEFKPQRSDGSLDEGLHFKFDLQANKVG